MMAPRLTCRIGQISHQNRKEIKVKMRFKDSTLLIVLISASVILFEVSVWAGPFLACDPPPAEEHVSSSQVEFDGTWEAAVSVEPCTDKAVGCTYTDEAGVKSYILLDLAGIADGSHIVRARFTNFWEVGDPSDPFDFAKLRPGKRALRLIP